jgi:acyl-CoA thioesterase
LRSPRRGLLATLADTVCFFQARLLPSGLQVATSNLNLNYIRCGQAGDRLLARSQILHFGRRIVSLSVSIHNGQNQLLAHGTSVWLKADRHRPPFADCRGCATMPKGN